MVDKINCNVKGSMTIEAASIIPLIIIILIVLIYISDMLYQQVYTQTIVHNALIKGVNAIKSRQIRDDNQVIKYMDDYIRRCIEQECDVNIDIRDRYIYKEIYLGISKKYLTPFSLLNRSMGIDEEFKIKANVNTIVYNEVRLISDIDLLIDVADKIPAIKEIKDKYLEKIAMIRNRLEEYSR